MNKIWICYDERAEIEGPEEAQVLEAKAEGPPTRKELNKAKNIGGIWFECQVNEKNQVLNQKIYTH